MVYIRMRVDFFYEWAFIHKKKYISVQEQTKKKKRNKLYSFYYTTTLPVSYCISKNFISNWGYNVIYRLACSSSEKSGTPLHPTVRNHDTPKKLPCFGSIVISHLTHSIAHLLKRAIIHIRKEVVLNHLRIATTGQQMISAIFHLFVLTFVFSSNRYSRHLIFSSCWLECFLTTIITWLAHLFL